MCSSDLRKPRRGGDHAGPRTAVGCRWVSQDRMRVPLFFLALVAGASASAWSDTSKLLGTTDDKGGSWHGPGLTYKGEVWNGDKTVRFGTDSYIAKSVITGKDSYYPKTLPETLKTPYLVADSTHPNLAFWYTPDVFEQDGMADGAKVSEWKNAANICYEGFTLTQTPTANALDVANDCTSAKKSNSQAVAGGNNKHVEVLKQDNVHHQPIYKKNVLNGHGVVRFRRADKHGFDGQFLEVHKRCADFTCAAADAGSGFLPLASTEDWTNGVAGAGGTAFTITMVVKTYQTPGDVNPMGILNVVKGNDAKKGLGIFKTPSKCQPVLKSAITAAGTSGTVLNAAATRQLYLTTDAYGKRSTEPGAYNGMYAHIQGHTNLASGLEAQTGLAYTNMVCKIDQYLVVGYVKTTLTAAGTTEIVLEGGAGKVMGQTVDNTAGQWPTIRIGKITAAGAGVLGDQAITAVAADGADTKITITTATDFSTVNLVAGTAIYFAVGKVATEFYTTFVSECTGTKLDAATANPIATDAGAAAVEIIPGDGVRCKGDKGAKLGPYGRMSTLSGYYGGAQDAARDDVTAASVTDSGCETECTQFGCDPDTGSFGDPGPIVGELATALTADGLTTITLKGGAGKVDGWTVTDGLGPWPTLRFGSPDVAHASGDVIITAADANANGVDTDLTVADYDAATNSVAAGTKVYLAIGATATDFNNEVFKNSCVKKWGSARSLQDPDDRFRVVTIRVSGGTAAEIYIDGLHDGCEGADTAAGDACSLTSPAAFTGVTAQQLDSLRLGVMSVGPAKGTASSTATAQLAGALTNSFANVDFAEMLIYNKALSPEEMDRVGNYLAVKYDLSQYKLNSFIRSPTRSVAVSAGAGCDKILFKPHTSSICDGYPTCAALATSPIAGNRANDLIVLSRALADSDTDDYYIGMRLFITGGGASTDGLMLSAKGQSCRVSDYTAATRSATCDLSNQGQSSFVLWGSAVLPPDPAGANAVAATDTLLTVAWVPTNWQAPYFAKIGDPTGDCEVVKIMSVGIVGNKYQLTVIRAFAGAAAADITWAHSKEFNVAATITYSRSVVMRDIATGNADGNIVMAGFISSCGVDQHDPRCALASDILPLAEPADETVRNLQIKVTPKTANQDISVAVKNLRPFKWTLAAGLAIDPTLVAADVQATGTIDAVNPAFDAGAPHGLVAGDLLLLGSLADGEVLRVTSITDADTVAITRGHALDRVMSGRPTWTLVGKDAAGADAAAADTSFVVSTAFTAPVDSLLLCGTVAAGTVGAGSATENEIVKVTAVSADGLTLTVARGDGTKPGGVAGTTAAIQTQGTILTLLTKVHAVGTPLTLIGKDGEPLVQADLGTANAGANAMTLAEGTLVDFAIKPLGGRIAQEGSKYVGGSGVSTYKLEPCDPYLPPYTTDAPIQIVQGQEYLKSPGSGFGGSFTADTRTTGNAFWASADGVGVSSATGPVSAPASGGTVLELKGWYLAPSDLVIEGAKADYDTAGDKYLVRGSTTERNENYLLVTVGARPSECSDPTQTTPCADGKYEKREAALECNMVETPSGYCALDWTKPCKCPHGKQCLDDCGGTAGNTNVCKSGPAYGATTAWYPTAKTSMRCALPGTLNANQNLNVYWHGVKTTFTNWYRPHAPVVTQLMPSAAVYSGGDTVTILGSNFGPKDVWTAVNKAGTKTVTTRTATVSFVGKGMAKMCDSLVYVSDKQLICKVPALANQKQDMDKAARTVAVSVVVDAGGLRTRTDSSGTLQYSNVPTYFTCDSNQVSETGKNECFSCCRSACIVDEFAQGAQKGGATYSHCDTACYRFCGFTTK